MTSTDGRVQSWSWIRSRSVSRIRDTRRDRTWMDRHFGNARRSIERMREKRRWRYAGKNGKIENLAGLVSSLSRRITIAIASGRRQTGLKVLKVGYQKSPTSVKGQYVNSGNSGLMAHKNPRECNPFASGISACRAFDKRDYDNRVPTRYFYRNVRSATQLPSQLDEM